MGTAHGTKDKGSQRGPAGGVGGRAGRGTEYTQIVKVGIWGQKHRKDLMEVHRYKHIDTEFIRRLGV